MFLFGLLKRLDSMRFSVSSLICLLLLLSSCAPFSKSQLKLTHNYFETITNYSNYYRELNTSLADLELESKNLESALEKSDSLRVSILIESISSYERSLRIPDSIAAELKFIETYIQDYYLLIPDGFNIYKALKGTTQTIGGLFGLGGVVEGILPKNVPGLNPKRKRKIRNHLYRSEEELLSSLKSIRDYVDNSYLPHLELIDKRSMVDFEQMLISINSKTEPMDYYTYHNRVLTNFYRKLFVTKSLATNLSASIEPFIRTEKRITTTLEKREKINPETQHLSELIRNIQRIKLLINDIKKEESIK